MAERGHHHARRLRRLAQAKLDVVRQQTPHAANAVLERHDLELELDLVLAVDLRPHVDGLGLRHVVAAILEDDLGIADREAILEGDAPPADERVVVEVIVAGIEEKHLAYLGPLLRLGRRLKADPRRHGGALHEGGELLEHVNGRKAVGLQDQLALQVAQLVATSSVGIGAAILLGQPRLNLTRLAVVALAVRLVVGHRFPRLARVSRRPAVVIMTGIADFVADVDHGPMLLNLALSTFMVSLTVSIHLGGLLALLWVLRDRAHRVRAHDNRIAQVGVLVFVVLGLLGIHTVEIWLYGLMFWAIGAIPDFETALYFSTVTFTTIGYGDVVLDKKWRMFGAIEAANGLILFGWSTAFLFSVTTRLRMLEHDWLERPDPSRGRHEKD